MKRSSGLLRDMEIFVRLVETQSFTEAARSLALPKSTVSRRIDALEASLGVHLVRRNNRGLIVTELGSAYYQRARGVIGLAEDAVQAVVGEQRLRGALRMTAPRAIGAQIVADVLSGFLREHPEVSAELLLTDRPLDMQAGRFDLAVRVGQRLQLPEGFEAQPLSKTWIVLCASAAYLARRGALQHPSDLARHDAIMVSFLGGRRWHLRGPGGVADVDVAGRLSVDDMTMAERAARAGLGVAPIAAAIAGPLVRAGQLAHVLPQWTLGCRSLFAVYPEPSRQPARARRLLSHVVTHLRAAIAERTAPVSAAIAAMERSDPPGAPAPVSTG